ncbi:general stress protein ydaD [Acrasis kona]|uniref:General stress protein ydaD n=1 Tax=Acrasis kona TaxID=1008807 RepID=A0AAW2ZJJ8_9EUKA
MGKDAVPSHKEIPAQQQEKPGLEHKMTPEPTYDMSYYKGTGKLQDRVALITGGDSGIGRSVALLYAREGADVAIIYLPTEQTDAEITKALIENEGRKALLIPGDIADSDFCKQAVERTVKELGRLNILVNNAATQEYRENFLDTTDSEIERTFKVNIFAMMYLTRAAIPHLHGNDSIINTTSINAYRGHPVLIPYTTTKGAIVAFTRSMALHLADKKIRVNAVAPGPIWTPLIVSTMPSKEVEGFGKDVAMERPGQPFECATSYVFLASQDSSYFTGQVFHPNGGEIING